MPDHRLSDAVPLTGATVGTRVLGPTVVVIDDDCFTVGVSDAAEGAWSVRVDTVVALVREESGVTLRLRDGGSVVLLCADGHALATRLRSACHRVPELTRALRSMGARRSGDVFETDGGRATAEGLFFAPFLAARRAAAQSTEPGAAIAAFDVAELTRGVQQAVERVAAERTYGNAALRRAVEAQGEELLEPLIAALRALGTAGDEARRDLRRSGPDDAVLSGVNLGSWRAWADALCGVFNAADRAWANIDRLLTEVPAAPVQAPRRRGLRR
jgi:Arc/MetJ family transcription regulator